MWGPTIMPLIVLLVLFVVAAFWDIYLLHYSYIYISVIILRL